MASKATSALEVDTRFSTSVVVDKITASGEINVDSLNVTNKISRRGPAVLFYYGFPTLVNSLTDDSTYDKHASIFSFYDIIVFGEGIELSTHANYTARKTIIRKIKEIKPEVEIFGYIDIGVSTNNFTIAAMQTSVDNWEAVGANGGIFLDDYGYDFQTSRARQNTMVDYIHSKGFKVFANANNLDDVTLATYDGTYNPSQTATSLVSTDYWLWESMIVNTNAYTTHGGHPAVSDFITEADRVVTALNTGTITPIALNIVEASYSRAQQEDFWDTCQAAALIYGMRAYALAPYLFGASGDYANTVLFFDYESWASEAFVEPGGQLSINQSATSSPVTWKRHIAGHEIEFYMKDTTGPWYGIPDAYNKNTTGRFRYVEYTAAGAITQREGIAAINSSTALAMTLADPRDGIDDGKELVVVIRTVTSSGSHTLQVGSTGFNAGGSGNDLATFPAADSIGDNICLIASGGSWLVKSSVGSITYS